MTERQMYLCAAGVVAAIGVAYYVKRKREAEAGTTTAYGVAPAAMPRPVAPPPAKLVSPAGVKAAPGLVKTPNPNVATPKVPPPPMRAAVMPPTSYSTMPMSPTAAAWGAGIAAGIGAVPVDTRKAPGIAPTPVYTTMPVKPVYVTQPISQIKRDLIEQRQNPHMTIGRVVRTGNDW